MVKRPTEERITLATADECFASCFCTDGHWICSSSVRLKRHFMSCFVFIWKPTLSCLHSAAHAHYNKIRRIKKKKRKKRKNGFKEVTEATYKHSHYHSRPFLTVLTAVFPKQKRQSTLQLQQKLFFQLMLTSAASQGFTICTNLWFIYERQYILLGFVVAIKPKSTITSHFYYA